MVALQKELWRFFFKKNGNPQQYPVIFLAGQTCCWSNCLERVQYVKAVSVYLKLKLKEQRLKFLGNHVMCLLLEITTILKITNEHSIFFNEDLLLNGSWANLDGDFEMESSVEGQLFFKGGLGISGAWRSGLRKAVRAEDVLENCMLKHCFPLKTFIPNTVALFVLWIALSCIWKISTTITTAKWEFTLAIVSLSTSQEVDIVH